eukprot:222963-Prorocentrum_minimum.AAC.1
MVCALVLLLNIISGVQTFGRARHGVEDTAAMAAASIGFREPDGKLLVAQCLYASIHKTIGFPPEQEACRVEADWCDPPPLLTVEPEVAAVVGVTILSARVVRIPSTMETVKERGGHNDDPRDLIMPAIQMQHIAEDVARAYGHLERRSKMESTTLEYRGHYFLDRCAVKTRQAILRQGRALDVRTLTRETRHMGGNASSVCGHSITSQYKTPIVWMLRANMWMLRAKVWMLRAKVLMLRAIGGAIQSY